MASKRKHDNINQKENDGDSHNTVDVPCDKDCPDCKKPKIESIGFYGIEKFIIRKNPNEARPVDNTQEFFHSLPGTSTSAAPISLTPKKCDINEVYKRVRDTYKRIDPKRYIIHMTLHFNRPEDIAKYQNSIIKKMIHKNNKMVLGVMSVHYGESEAEDHLHILHDCPYSNKNCRCSAFQLPDVKDKVKKAFSLTDMDGDMLARTVLHLRDGSGMFCVYFQRWRERASREKVEERRNARRRESCTSTSPDGVTCDSQQAGTQPPTNVLEALASMKKYMVRPLEDVNKTILWLQDEPDHITSLANSSPALRKAFKAYKQYYSPMTFDQLLGQHRSEAVKKLYSALNGEVWTTYLSESESTEVLDRFVIHQSEESKITPREFLEPIYKILTKDFGDKNCLVLLGPPGSKKTWLATIISDLMVNVGYIKIIDNIKYPFEDAAFRNLLIYDNCIKIPDKIEDTLRKVFAGKQVSVKTAQNNEEYITKTPVVVCMNRFIFPNYNYNSITHKVQLTPPLSYPQYPEKQIHPLALINLFEKYGIRRPYFRL